MSTSKKKLRAAQPFEISPELERDMVPIDAVRPYEGNPRRGDIEAIKASIRANGLYRAPVARRETTEILINNHTYLACREMGATAVPIDWRSIPDDARARRIMLADNRTSDLAGYEKTELYAQLQAEEQSGAGAFEGTGFDKDFFAGLQNEIAMPTGPEDTPPPLPAKARTRRGHVIKLGPHRLLCADATDPKAARKLLGQDTIDLVWTDPPYGVDLGPLAASRGRDHGDMVGDDDGEAAAAVCQQALAIAHEHAAPGAAVYLAHPDTHGAIFRAALEGAGWSLRQVLQWIKDTLVLGRQDYQWRHEPILYGWKAGTHRWFGQYDKTTIIDGATRSALEALEHEDLVELAWRLLEEKPGTIARIARPRTAEHHPTSKPLRLVEPHLRNSSPPGGIIYDPFAGSGTTLIAAHRAGREARLIEIDPAYCDVIRDRYKEATDA